MEVVTNASPENLVEQILTHTARTLSEFNKYEVQEMLDTLTTRLQMQSMKRSTIGLFIRWLEKGWRLRRISLRTLSYASLGIKITKGVWTYSFKSRKGES